MKLGKMISAVSWSVGFALVFSAMSAPASAVITPEMDPGLATGALALLSSGLLLIAGRRRSK
jgi:hypothetical protein